MKLGPLIPELKMILFLFQEYVFSLQERYPPFQNFEVRTTVPPNFQKISNPPLFCKGDECIIELVRGTSIAV